MNNIQLKTRLIAVLFCSILKLQAGNLPDSLMSNKDSSNKEKRYFELSLGNSLLFISNSRIDQIHANTAVVVPTNALLVFAEFLPHKKMRIPLFANIPKESKQFIVNNTLVSERASPTFGFGLQFQLFKIAIGKKSRVEFESGPLASFLWSQNNVMKFAPLLAGRFRFLKNQDFVIYLGSSYSIGVNAVGVLFGTGYIF